MKLHGNARACPKSRRLLVERVVNEAWSVTAAAEAAGVSERTVWRWLKRWREEGQAGLLDRSSRPHRSPRRLAPTSVEAIRSLRRLRMTAAQIAETLGLALSTVSAWLKRIGLGKRSRLEPPEPPNRYERRHPGELVHVDIKQLGRISERGAGHRVVANRRSKFARRERGPSRGVTRFEYVHVMIDDHSRLAYAEVLATLTARCAIAFLRRAAPLVAWPPKPARAREFCDREPGVGGYLRRPVLRLEPGAPPPDEQLPPAARLRIPVEASPWPL